MKIRNYSQHPQTFGAKYITTIKIKEKIPFTPFYKKVNVDFVELERKHDIPSIQTYVAQDHYNVYGLDILTDLYGSQNDYRAYALTRQRIGHQALIPEKIIGICDGKYTYDWRDGNIFFINHLETKSENNKLRKPDKKLVSIFGLKIPVSEKLKGAGKAILRNIIRIHDESLDSIKLEAAESGKSFYRHIGFVNDSINPDYMCLPYNKFGRLNKI